MPQLTLDQAVNFAAQRHAAGDLAAAENMYRQILQLAPQRMDIVHALGVAMMQTGRVPEGVETVRKAIAGAPHFAVAYNSLGMGLQDLGRVSEAADAFVAGLERAPLDATILNNLGTSLRNLGRVDEAMAIFEQALQVDPRHASAASNLAFTVQFKRGATGPEILRCARRWQETVGSGIKTSVLPDRNRDPQRRLKIGYVSPYFRDHCIALYMVGLLRAHDRALFEIVCYSTSSVKDALTQKHRAHADVWRDAATMSDEQLAQQIQADGIDVLVDQAMHLAGGRLGVFARKPAPIQVTWIAYPGTTGLNAMDWRLTDVHLDPIGTHDDWYSERSWRLPDTFWCYDPLTDEPTVNELPALNTGRITFGCLNNYCKVNLETVELWAQIMERVPGSHLLLMSPEGPHRQRIIDTLRSRGTVEFVDRRPRADYLKLYHHIDISLDTFPYNGHTTSLDSYWMGVPVVTMIGNTAPARAGFSQLTNLNLLELCAKDETEFITIAADLTADLDRLSALRSTLRDRMKASTLMDAPRFARNIEAAYRGIWQNWASTPS